MALKHLQSLVLRVAATTVDSVTGPLIKTVPGVHELLSGPATSICTFRRIVAVLTSSSRCWTSICATTPDHLERWESDHGPT